MYGGVAEKMSVSVHSDSQLTTASQANRFLFYLALCFCVRYPMHLITLMDHSSAASPVYRKQQHVNCAEVFQELNLPWYNLQPFHSLHQSKTRGGETWKKHVIGLLQYSCSCLMYFCMCCSCTTLPKQLFQA